MKKGILIAGAILLLAGVVITVGALATVGFKVHKFSTIEMETNTYPVTGDFDSIEIEENTSDVVFRESEDGTCSVVCYEPKKTAHTVETADGTLKIAAADQRDWTGFMDLSFETRKMTVYLPKNEFADLTVHTKTGDVDIPEGLRFNNATITGSTSDVRCGASVSDKLSIRLSTGDITLSGVSAGAIDCTVTTGDIRFESVSCTGDVMLKVSTGRTAIDELTCRNLHSEGSTGKASFNNVVVTGTLAIERDTGDVDRKSVV